jgi:surfactin synthase thioesterase subunit
MRTSQSFRVHYTIRADKAKDGKAPIYAFLGTIEEIYTLSRLIEYHNETAATTLKWSTLKHYYVTQRYLVKFIQQQFK